MSAITRDGCLTKPVIKSIDNVIYLMCADCRLRERLGYTVSTREYLCAVDRHRSGGSR